MRILTLSFLLSLLFTHHVFADSTSIGSVDLSKGPTSVERSSYNIALAQKDAIFWKDIIKTGAQARLKITFLDETTLQLGDHSIFEINELVYDPNAENKAIFTLSEGVFRMVSGAINKMDNAIFEVRTPLATIGVRGTDFWGLHTKDKLTLALLDDSRLEVSTAAGDFVLDTPRSAIVIERDQPLGEVFILTDDQLADAVKTIQ